MIQGYGTAGDVPVDPRIRQRRRHGDNDPENVAGTMLHVEMTSDSAAAQLAVSKSIPVDFTAN